MKTATKKLLQIVLAVMCIVFVGAGLLGFTQGKRAYAEGTGMTAGLTEIEEPTGILHIETGKVKKMTYKGVYNVDGKIAYHFVNETESGNAEARFSTKGTDTTPASGSRIYDQLSVSKISFSYKLTNSSETTVADGELGAQKYLVQIFGSGAAYGTPDKYLPVLFEAAADGEWHTFEHTLTDEESALFCGFIVKMGGLSGEMLIGDVNVTVPAFVTGTVPVTAENEALYGWQYYYAAGANISYFKEGFSVTASTEGHNGNQSMVATRNVECADEMVLYSYDFAVTAGKTYEVSYFVKGSADNAADAKVSFNVSDGGTLSDTLITIASTDTDWKEVKFGYTVQSNKLVLRASVSGKGTVYFSDVTVKEVTSGAANSPASFKLMTIGNTKNGAADGWSAGSIETGMRDITSDRLSTDSADGDGASLIMNDYDIIKVDYGRIPAGVGKNYKLSYKYKYLSSGVESALISIRMDGFEPNDGGQFWYVNNEDSSHQNEWATFEKVFSPTHSGKGSVEGQRFTLMTRGNYLIDDICITSLDDGMQFIPGGSFSEIYLGGINGFGGSLNYARQGDGSFVFVAGNYQMGGTIGRSYFDIDTTHLEEGKTYTLSFDWRGYTNAGTLTILEGNNWQNHAAVATWAADNNTAWTHKEVDFVAGKTMTDGRKSIHLEVYGSENGAFGSSPAYYRNFHITDAEGNEYFTNKTLVNPGTTYGENTFKYGTFAGDTSFKTDWTFTGNGTVLGQKFADGNGDWRIILNNGDTAKSAPINVSFNVMRIFDNKTGAAEATLVTDTGDVVVADANGNFNIPEGAKTVSIVYAASGYTVIKSVTTSTHTHGVACGTEMLPATYEWNGNECTAEYGYYKVCGAKSESYVTETVKATLVGDTATYTKAGTATLVATFTNEAFTEQRLENVATEMKTVDVKTLGGVSFRANEPYGLRWAAGISKADYDAIVAMYGEENVKAGVLIAPYDYVSGEFTAAALEESGKSYKLVDNLGGFNERLTAANEGYNCWFGSLVGIQDHNLDREFAGRAYIEIKDGEDTVIRYAEFVKKAHVRTAYDICKSAMADDTLDDATKIFVKSVLDKVVAVKIEDGVATLDAIAGYTAPYTVSYAEGVLTITPAAGVNAETVAKVIVNGVSKTFTVANGVVTVTVA